MARGSALLALAAGMLGFLHDVARSFIVYIPASYDPAVVRPLYGTQLACERRPSAVAKPALEGRSHGQARRGSEGGVSVLRCELGVTAAPMEVREHRRPQV